MENKESALAATRPRGHQYAAKCCGATEVYRTTRLETNKARPSGRQNVVVKVYVRRKNIMKVGIGFGGREFGHREWGRMLGMAGMGLWWWKRKVVEIKNGLGKIH